MDTRPRTRLLHRAVVAVALGALVVPATADAAKKKKTKLPVITKVTPKTAFVNETLVVAGKNFRVGKNKNTIMFKRDGGKALFVKGGLATKRQIALVIPKSLEKYMATPAGSPTPTRFRLKVLTTKLSRKYTKVKSSPVIGPEKPVAPPKPPNAPDGDCDGDGQLNSVDVDDDNDLLLDAQEIALKLDPCSGDSDGDGVEDGYEYQSAMDLNNDDYQHANYITPFPGKTPYPNPLFADADVDYDGDGLSLNDEYLLWKYTYEVNHTAARTLNTLSYSDGAQYSLSQLANTNGVRQPTMLVSQYTPPLAFRQWADIYGYGSVQLFSVDGAHTRSPVDLYDMDRDTHVTTVPTGDQYTAEATYWDLDRDQYVSDDERDEDADGLTNYHEVNGPMTAGWWKACYPKDGEYPIRYAGTKAYDGDSDGDGILDGADDQDFDDVPNIQELSRNMAGNTDFNATCGTGGSGWTPSAPAQTYVNPFNPCLPDRESRTCPRHPVMGQAYAPFIDHWEPLIAN
jgi:hypothetical protein